MNQVVPKPVFSANNPYWQRIIVEGVREEYQPQLSVRDFHYAWTWEITKKFVGSEVVLAIITAGWLRVWAHIFSQRFHAKAIEISRRLRASSEGPGALLRVQALPSVGPAAL